MSASKFVVYSQLLFQLTLLAFTQSVSASECFTNCSATTDCKLSESNCHSNHQATPETFNPAFNMIEDGINHKGATPETTATATATATTPMRNDAVLMLNDRLIVQRSSENTTPQKQTEDSDFRFLITGGYRPEKNDLAKFVVSLRYASNIEFFGDNHMCGGSIISKSAVLTAAHCLFLGRNLIRANKLKVVAGTPRRLVKTIQTQELSVVKVKPHPKYSPATLDNDVGILRLSSDFKIDGLFVDIIPLPESGASAGMKCTVVGWGTVVQFGPIPDEIVNGDVTINSNSFCQKLGSFEKGMLCASNAVDHEVDSCQGDSGGPLICTGSVVGIVSFGYGCGIPGSAGVYTDVYYYKNWITNNGATQVLGYLLCLMPLIPLTMHKTLI